MIEEEILVHHWAAGQEEHKEEDVKPSCCFCELQSNSSKMFLEYDKKERTQEFSKFINIIFKTNINPTEYDSGALKSIDALIPASSTAF